MRHFELGHFTISEVLITVCVLLSSYFVFMFYNRKKKNLPPGPIGLPIVGYLPFLTNKPHLKFTELASKYGDVFSLQVGNKQLVVLNSAKVVRDAFSKAELLGRPPGNTVGVAQNFNSPFFLSGKTWQEHRRFALHLMRDLGFGKSRMEKHIIEEVEHVLKAIKEKGGNPIATKPLFTPSVSNNICALVFGSRYDYEDPERQLLDTHLRCFEGKLQVISSAVYFPRLKIIDFLAFNKQHLRKTGEKIRNFVRKRIEQHKETLDPNNIRDFIDGYLLEMEQRQEKDSDTTFSDELMFGSIMSLFNAGSESMRTSLEWFFYTMAVFPDIQKKVQHEIDEIIGTQRSPSWNDHKLMPYTKAVLQEMNRWHPIAALNLLRYALDDTTIEGYDIPRGTLVLANFWAVHRDPRQWENPSAFKPDRFLIEDGKNVIRTDSYMPFSFGKRACPGEILALVEGFLYFTSVLQKFTVKIPEGQPISFETNLSVTLQLKPHKLIFEPRLEN